MILDEPEWWATGVLILALVVAAGFAWPRQGLALHRDLVIGWVRAVVQLSILAGLLLLAAQDDTWIVAGLLVLVIWGFGTQVAGRRSWEALDGVGLAPPDRRGWLLRSAPVVILPGTLVITLLLMSTALPLEILVVLPLAGMFTGHAMNAASQAAQAFLWAAVDRRAEVEQWVLLGHDRAKATAAMTGETLTLTLTPTINNLLTVGIVVIPGAMLGLLLAGTAPLEAARIQLLILVGWITSGWLGSSLMLRRLRSELFDAHDRLRLPGRA